MKRALPVTHAEPLAERVAMGLQKVGLALKHQTWRQASVDGLSPTQGQIVALLANSALTASEVAQQLGITLPTVSDSVRVLVEKELVEKSPDPRHPRASLLTLTSAGREQLSKVRAWPEFLSTAVGAMSTDEQTVFLSGLMKMIRALQESGQIPLARMCVTCRYFRQNAHEQGPPHHCAFVDAPLGAGDLRMDCREHEAVAG